MLIRINYLLSIVLLKFISNGGVTVSHIEMKQFVILTPAFPLLSIVRIFLLKITIWMDVSKCFHN